MSFGHFVCLWRPGQPVRYWDRKNRDWLGDARERNAYRCAAAANRAAGQIKTYMLPADARCVQVDYLSFKETPDVA